MERFLRLRTELAESRLVLSKGAVRRLHEYKFHSGPYTPMDNFFDKFWWNPVSKLLPEWMAPNFVTAIGSMWLLFTTAVFVVHRSSGGPVSPWVWLLEASGLFWYQTFDAIDGKQARRTGTSSALGAIFDHGCDALMTPLIGYAFIESVVFSTAQGLTCLIAVQLAFFAAQMEDYHCHVLRTGFIQVVGCTEGQVFAWVLLLCHFVFGTPAVMAFFGTPIGLGGFFYRDVILGIYMTVNIGIFVQCIQAVVKKVPVSAWSPQLLPFALSVAGSACTAWVSLPFPLAVRFASLAVSALITSMVIVGSTTGVPHSQKRCYSLILSLFALLAVVAAGLFSRETQCFFCGMYCLYVVLTYVKYASRTAEELAAYLDIKVFSIPSKAKSSPAPSPRSKSPVSPSRSPRSPRR